MTMKRTCLMLIAGVTLVAVTWQFTATSAANAQSGTRSGAGARSQGGTRPFEARLWDYLQNAQYWNWAPVPGKTGDAYPGQSPHGAFLKMYLNRTAAGHVKELPHGSILVKENYGEDRETLMAITIMYRSKGYNPDAGDWYWVKYNTDGTVAKAPPEMGSLPLMGKVNGCIMCHDGADGKDFAFVNDGQ